MVRRKLLRKPKRPKKMDKPWIDSEVLKPHLVNFDTFLQIDASTQCIYRIGSFIINIQNDGNCLASSTVYLHLKENNAQCFLCWKEVNKANESQVKFSFAKCGVPYEILTLFTNRNLFHLILDANDSESDHLTVNLYICPKLILPLSYASEPVSSNGCYRHAVQLVVEYFHGISFEAYKTGHIGGDAYIEELYKSIQNTFKPDVVLDDILHPFLVPKLRQYQTQAVRWMLNSEKQLEMENDNRLHILYEELKTKDGYSIYYHKYAGIFVTSKFAPLPLCKGGILADEMGMGKTLEVLACILLNPRPVSINTIANQRDEPTDLPDSFECICGDDSEYDSRIKCLRCGLVQHADCVLANPSADFVKYICPYCWVDSSMKPVQSRATLIVSPASILFQWKIEIEKHLKEEKLKVLIYHGIEHHRFINPELLADHDIVLSSYETFRKEVSHVHLPHGESQRSLRHPKKFRALPSPLSAVEWWRVCLDEAQMVESVATKTAQMALELHCINRWCVTGTPIQKSFEDLYGLLLFLGFNPYNTKVWWNELVSKPFINGNASTFNFVLNSVLWRTSKSCVLDQTNIPQQETIVHYVHFSEIERVFYESMHLKCERSFIENVRKYNCEDINLHHMDKHLLAKILLPLKNLQKACSHFQLSGGKFEDIQRSKMTIPELLEFMLTKTHSETEEINRQLISSLNGLAGIYSIQGDYKRSCQTYNKVLVSVRENNQKNIRTDILQEIHTQHNYAKSVSSWVNTVNELDEIEETVGYYGNIFKFIDDLNERSNVLSKVYLEKFSSAIQVCNNMLAENREEIHEIKSHFQCVNISSSLVSTWSLEMLDNIVAREESYLIGRIKASLINAPGSNFLSGNCSVSDRFSRISGLRFVLFTLSTDLHEARSSLLQAVKMITSTPTPEVVNNASGCHLRVIRGLKIPKCIYCKADDVFNTYESKLFRFAELPTEQSNTQDIFRQRRQGTHSDSELEVILKELINYSRTHEGLRKYTDEGLNELKLFDAMKKELKNLRATWLKMSEYVSAIDEVEMSKIALRLIKTGENSPNPPLPYLILPNQLQLVMMQNKSNIIEKQEAFKNKLGHLFYLQNLKKNKNEDGPFEEACPVCRQTFKNTVGLTWSVLQCGHSLCNVCVHQLMHSSVNSKNEFRCPVCRVITSGADIYCVDNSKPIDQEMEITIKGNFSAKISAVVKCLIHIREQDGTAKSLVFSHWPGLLTILAEALAINEMNFLFLKDKKTLQNIGTGFKNNSSVNILLLPLSLGSNGLNIVEATHVLLIEPSMDYSKILQAIGRVHRIGQTRETYVHKFVLKDTIDENIHNIHDVQQLISHPSTVNDLVQLLHVKDA